VKPGGAAVDVDVGHGTYETTLPPARADGTACAPYNLRTPATCACLFGAVCDLAGHLSWVGRTPRS
tara:strand:+ start:199 stop:396 length:198 start_codon:yes stop_codon:yes gene_type:complete